ncbi:CopD family protein [Paenibacillus terrigena]|uniref:copper resistance CopC/CopD family protein n=1 Tax=Paenibacillus terrigena TaxID=369333 RepID=UPI0028D85967|nr:CopD family protein [Paenibacillus terrigena]
MKKFHIGWLVCVMVLFVLFPQGVDAHAQIQRSSPAAESELSSAPREIRITYTENINGDLSAATLWTESGDSVSVKLSTENDNVLILTPSSDLADGVYKVKWQVLSVDTHVTEGSFRFAVGAKLETIRPHDTISLDGDTTGTGKSSTGTGAAVKPSTDTSQSKGKKAQQPTASNKGTSDKSVDAAASKPKDQSVASNPITGKDAGGASDQAGTAGQVKDKEKSNAGKEAVAVEAGASDSGSATSPQAGTNDGTTGGASSAGQVSEPSKAEVPLAKDSTDVKRSADSGSTPVSQDNSDSDMSGMDHSDSMDGMDMEDMEGMGASGITIDWNKLLRVIELFVMAAIGGFWYVRSFLLRKDEVPADGLVHRIFSAKTERIVYLVGIILFLVMGISHLLQLAIQLNTSGTLDAEAWRNTGVLLRSTLIGTVVWVRPILLAALIASSIVLSRSAAAVRIGVQGILLAAVAITFPFTGHSWADESIRLVTVSFDLLHLVMAVVWFGGLVALGVMTWQLPKDRVDLEKIHQVVRRFSNVALPLIATVAITGLLLSLIRVTSWSALFHSDYGQTLVWKIILFILAMLLAGVQRLVVLPYLQRQGGEAEGRMLTLWKFSIRAELCIAMIIFIVAGFLSTTAPPMS